MSDNSAQNQEASAYVQACHHSFTNIKHEHAIENAVAAFLTKFVAPPKLILLWVMSTLTRQEILDVVECVHQCLSNTFTHNPPPMIGTTVRACLVDGKVQEQGAVLVGIASNHLDITTCLVQSDGKLPRTTAEELLDSLQISTSSNTRETKWHKTIVHAYLSGSSPTFLCRAIIAEISCLTDGMLKMLGGGAVAVADTESGLVFERGKVLGLERVAGRIPTALPCRGLDAPKSGGRTDRSRSRRRTSGPPGSRATRRRTHGQQPGRGPGRRDGRAG